MAKNDPNFFPELFRDFAMMPRFAENIEALAAMAEPEDWEYRNTPSPNPAPVLRNYLAYTYQRVAEERKIVVADDQEHCCWNTGLITPNQEPVFALFEKNQLQEVQTLALLAFRKKGRTGYDQVSAPSGYGALFR
jgi:hypothetical protein